MQAPEEHKPPLILSCIYREREREIHTHTHKGSFRKRGKRPEEKRNQGGEEGGRRSFWVTSENIVGRKDGVEEVKQGMEEKERADTAFHPLSVPNQAAAIPPLTPATGPQYTH